MLFSGCCCTGWACKCTQLCQCLSTALMYCYKSLTSKMQVWGSSKKLASTEMGLKSLLNCYDVQSKFRDSNGWEHHFQAEVNKWTWKWYMRCMAHIDVFLAHHFNPSTPFCNYYNIDCILQDSLLPTDTLARGVEFSNRYTFSVCCTRNKK